MVNLMRRHQQVLLTIVTVIIIIAFAWLYNDYKFQSRGQDAVGIIYDRPVSIGQYQRTRNSMELARGLQMFDLLGGLAGNAQSMQEAETNYIFNTFVLRHESTAMGLVPTEAEVIDEIKKMPAFQSNGAFDPTKYEAITKNIGYLGLDSSGLEEIVKDNLRMRKLREIFDTTISVSPGVAREMFEKRNQKIEIAVVRLKQEEVAKTIEVGEEDLKKIFEERKETLKTEEERKVKFVSFVLNDEEKKLSGRERAAALQKALDKAEEFVVAMTQKDAKFEDVSAKMTKTVAETPEFARTEPPAELGGAQEAAEAAFAITMEQPNSSAVRTPNGYYVLQLSHVTPARALTYDEAKAKLADTVKSERLAEAMTLKGTEIRNKIDAELKAGKSFADAAQAAGQTAETLPAMSFMEPPKPDVLGGREALSAAAEMTEGQLSEVTDINSGKMIFRVEKRLPIDDASFDKEKPQLVENLAKSKAMQAFPLWFAERRKAANLQTRIGS